MLEQDGDKEPQQPRMNGDSVLFTDRQMSAREKHFQRL